MRLKNLTIKGFKSFADETEINFNENLIGIVGPNGSGKSNIVDAIRWVLGEQKTSELRLDAMADVVFSGTDDRKEGRVARVTLTFDNTKHILPVEFSEVSISRLLYRDGTSEYRLNKVPCRKKDITSLFIDSGIGSNSYAIISLHMVEDILTDNGQSRRRMLEQAAGISKYKIRKKETLSKLRSTSEDLDRVEDLLYEIKKNMKSFERQARRTEQFNKLKLSYRNLSLAIAKEDYLDHGRKKEVLEAQLKSHRDNRLSLDGQINNLEAEIQKSKTEIITYERSLSTDQQAFNSCMERLAQLENQKSLLSQRLETSRERLSQLTETKGGFLNSERQLKREIKEIEEALSSAVHLYGQSEKNLQSAEKKSETAGEDYNRLRLLQQERQSTAREHRDRMAANTESLSQTRARLQLFEQDITKLSGFLNELSTAIREKEGEATAISDNFSKSTLQIDGIKVKIKAIEEVIGGLNNTILNLQKEYAKKESEILAAQDRLNFFEDLVRKQEGLPESISFLRESKKTDAPVLADVVQVGDKELAPVVEMLLEPLVNALILDGDSKAIELYKLVRQSQKGKLHILLKDQDHHVPPPAPPEMHPLIDYLDFEAVYSPLINAICRSVFVCQKDPEKVDMTAVPHDATVLFPKAYLIRTPYGLYGGSDTLFGGLHLGRQQLIDELTERISSLQAALKKLDKEIEENQKALNPEHQKLENLNAALSSALQERDLISGQKIESEKTIEMLAVRHKQVANELAEKRTSVRDSHDALAKLEQLQKQFAQSGDPELSDESLGQEIESAYKSLQEASLEKEAVQRRFYDIKAQLEILQKDSNHHNERLERLVKEAQEADQEETELGERIKSLTTEVASLDKQVRAQGIEKDKIRKQLSEYEDTYYEQKGQIFEHEKVLAELRRKAASLDSSIARLNEDTAAISYAMKGIVDRIEIEFGATEDISGYEYELEGNADGWKDNRDKLREKIQRFGEINPMAISAYEEIKERHTYISDERDDILKAKSSLEQTISEIEETASKNFTEAVDAVRVNFRNVFQGLFSDDDDCDVVILNPDDPLESNIEIIAKPKGKRPKSINLLSGGEKALTAASFLFALYLLKPAPFCIFDEVDAPLDDVNVQKFNKLVRRFSNQSQFIIITHNKLTMAEVDVLYGVFLKEKGVSGVSAVDFRNYKEAEILTAPEAEIAM